METLTHTAPPVDLDRLVLPLLEVEKWECRACGIDAPCKVEITFSDAKLPEHLKGNQRFRRMVCLCEEKRPEWKRIRDGQNTKATHTGPESEAATKENL